MRAADERKLIGLAIVAWEDGLEVGKSGMPQNDNPYQHHQEPKLKQRWLDGWRAGHRMAEAIRSEEAADEIIRQAGKRAGVKII